MNATRSVKLLSAGHRGVALVLIELFLACAAVARPTEEPLGIVRLLHGQVQAKHIEQSQSRLLQPGSAVYSGDLVSTASDAWVTIQAFDNQLEFSIGPASREIELLKPDATSLTSAQRLQSRSSQDWQSPYDSWLHAGTLGSSRLPIGLAASQTKDIPQKSELRLQVRMKRAGSFFLSKLFQGRIEIETTWALIGIETTQIGVKQLANGMTIVQVLEGNALLRGKAFRSGSEPKPGEWPQATEFSPPVRVTTGYKAFVKPMGSIQGIVYGPSPIQSAGPRFPATQIPGDPPVLNLDPSSNIRPPAPCI